MCIYVVRTSNGKTLSGFRDIESAERSRDYWQEQFDNSTLARETQVEIRVVKETEDEEV